MTTNFTTKTPGKLYISGEYAILEPGQLALIKNIPIYMTAHIRPSQTVQIQSDMFDYAVGREPDKNYALIQETIDLFEAYLSETLPAFRLNITGKLEKNGKKYGIGSSGSVVILTLKALAGFMEISLPKDILFKLACLVLLQRGDNGSMGDLACIAYDDFVAYTSFDRLAIKELLPQKSLIELLEWDWGYDISPIKITLPATIMVGWTQEPAISKELVKAVKTAITPTFLAQSLQLNKTLNQALEIGDKVTVIDTIKQLANLMSHLHPAIMTTKLNSLVNHSLSLGAVAKSSGAGGGDCGIALVFNHATQKELEQLWAKDDIILLYCEEWGTYEP